MSPSAEPPLGVRASLEVARTLWAFREVAGVCPIFFCFLALSLRRSGVHPHLPRRLGILSQKTGRGGKNAAERRATQEEEEPSVGTGLMRRVLLDGPIVYGTYWKYVI